MEEILLDLQNDKGFSYNKGEDVVEEEHKIIEK